MGVDRAGPGNAGAPKAAVDQLSAFRRSNDELTFIDSLMGKAGECSPLFILGRMPRL